MQADNLGYFIVIKLYITNKTSYIRVMVKVSISINAKCNFFAVEAHLAKQYV